MNNPLPSGCKITILVEDECPNFYTLLVEATGYLPRWGIGFSRDEIIGHAAILIATGHTPALKTGDQYLNGLVAHYERRTDLEPAMSFLQYVSDKKIQWNLGLITYKCGSCGRIELLVPTENNPVNPHRCDNTDPNFCGGLMYPLAITEQLKTQLET